MIRLLICDDSDGARSALRMMLDAHGEIEIVGEAANGEEAVALAGRLSPDVVLMDVAMPVLDGVQATRRIRRLLPTARIVAFAGSSEDEVVNAMLSAGANAYCVKGAPLWELERAIAGASDPLVRLAHALARSVNAGGIGGLLARELNALTGGAVAAIYLAGSDAGLALAGAAGPAPDEALVSAPSAARRAFEERAPVSADAALLDELDRAGLPALDAIGLPLVCDGIALGSIFVAMPEGQGLVVDVELVAAVADLAATAFATERRVMLTHAEARRDALTGLPNRRAFDERLENLLAGNRRAAIALFDLDDFKHVNDRDGHEAGDAVLRAVARVAQRTLRATEELYRIGGDEFALVIESAEEAMPLVVERLRSALLLQRRPCLLPTISVGVVEAPANGRTRSLLLAYADAALYAAKRAGKSRTVVAGGRAERSLVTVGDHRGARVLVVDDDAALRALLRTTLEAIEVDVEEAESAAAARRAIASRRPDAVVLDIGMPGVDGLAFCRELKAGPRTRDIPVVILSGADAGTHEAARAVRAEAFLRKPFSPLDLLAVVERLLGGGELQPSRAATPGSSKEQLLLYAEDLRRLLERERGQRALIQQAYRKTLGALAAALESKDIGTGAHSQRVQLYASELARALEPALLDDPSVEYGFLLHDLGKIGIPDRILQKPGPLTSGERGVLQKHTVIGEQMLDGVPLLAGEGLRIVRSHHERWDGRGYPDGLAGSAIPLGARVFAVADAIDAMTSDRPYRDALGWDNAVAEIVGDAGAQFDPDVVDVFREREATLRRIYHDLTASAVAGRE
jgi:diguanylate cyclase (GGDEF)-like protein